MVDDHALDAAITNLPALRSAQARPNLGGNMEQWFGIALTVILLGQAVTIGILLRADKREDVEKLDLCQGCRDKTPHLVWWTGRVIVSVCLICRDRHERELDDEEAEKREVLG